MQGKPSPFYSNGYASEDLALTDPEHLRTTGWTYALGCRFSVLHGYGLGVLHLSLGTALHTIGFHTIHSSLFTETTTFTSSCQGSVELYKVRIEIETMPRIEQPVVRIQKRGWGTMSPSPSPRGLQRLARTRTTPVVRSLSWLPLLPSFPASRIGLLPVWLVFSYGRASP